MATKVVEFIGNDHPKITFLHYLLLVYFKNMFLVLEVKFAKYFSIIVDSTPDVSHIDQLCFVLRYVLPNGEPVERFLAFIPMHSHLAVSMLEIILEKLSMHGINIQNCRGQSYDNASNMSGIYSGLQARIKEINPLAEYIPCAAHSLNLVGVSAAESNGAAINFFGFLQEFYNFFSASTRRWDVLKSKFPAGIDVKVPKSLSQTRWSARADACLALEKGYSIYKVTKH